MNKTKLALGLAALGVTALFATVYAVDQGDKTHAQQNMQPFSQLNKDSLTYQAMTVIADAGCTYCHTPDSELPFYFKLPIANQLMRHDLEKGIKFFNINALFADVSQGIAPSETALARIENVINNDEMPPKLYTAMHWRAALSDDEKQVLQDWITATRATRNAESPATAAHKLAAVQPVYQQFATHPDKVALGNALFHDTRLSGDNSVSCASCHSLSKGGTDQAPTSTGIDGQLGGINAPTVFNAAFNRLQFWDGRADDLQAQAGGPPFNPIEMGSTDWQQVITKLQQDPAIVAQFAQVYQGEMTGETITDAIAEFEKTLITTNSRYDQYLMGNDNALNAQEKMGLALFNQHNCQGCHSGQAMGGESFETMGLHANYFAERGGDITEADLGRYNVTHAADDKHKFKVPTLRNIALTAPYFHDGQAKTLNDAVADMARFQVGVTLSQAEIDAMSAFLRTLTGEYQGEQLD